MKKKEYDRLFEDEFLSMESKLNDHIYKDKILNNIKTSFNMGAGKKFYQFLDEIDIEIGDLESDAIESRNPMIHDSIEISGNEEEVIRSSFAYRTMFHRILLKILGYSGQYVDYTIEGWPEKDISEVVGE